MAAEEVPDADESDDNVVEDNLDIDAALASIVSLGDAVAEHDEAEAEEIARQEAESLVIEQAEQAVREEAERRAAYYLPRPPMMTMQRGKAASSIPALLLIIIGSWLTFTFTTSDTPPPITTITLVAMGGIGLSLLAYWWSSGRWAIGALFGGTNLLLFSLSIIYLSQPDSLGSDGWPLLIVVPGVALLLGAILSSPVGKYHTLTGILLVMAGLLGLAVTTGRLDKILPDISVEFGLLILVILSLLVLLPPIIRRRKQAS